MFHSQLIDMFGDIDWAEKNNIGTKAMYILCASFLIIVGIFMLFGMGPKDPTNTDGIGFSTNKTLK